METPVDCIMISPGLQQTIPTGSNIPVHQKTPAYEYGDPNVPLDISNPDVIDYMMQTYILPAIEQGYQGIAFDNVDFNNNGNRCGVWRDGNWVEQPNYIEDVISWAASMYTRLHALYVGVAMNFPYDANHPAESKQIYQYLDIAVDEKEALPIGGDHNRIIYREACGLPTCKHYNHWTQWVKDTVSINGMPEDFDLITQAEKQWALANYLLAKGGIPILPSTASRSMGTFLQPPEYAADIGHARSVMYKSQNVYMRDFSNGLAIVNPSSSQSFTITLLPNTYEDLYGDKWNSITLEPLSGIVLLKKLVHTRALLHFQNFLNYFPANPISQFR